MRKCGRCGGGLDMLARADARFCSTRCRVAAHRASKLPVEMSGRRWVRADGKRPITTSGRPASSTNPSTWSTLADARSSDVGDGFGVMLGGGLGCYDLDHVTDDEVAAFLARVTEPVLLVERSVSGEGAHIFIAAEEASGWRRTVAGIHVERYSRARFIRTTLERMPLRG